MFRVCCYNLMLWGYYIVFEKHYKQGARSCVNERNASMPGFAEIRWTMSQDAFTRIEKQLRTAR